MIRRVLNLLSILVINLKRNFAKEIFIGIGLTFAIIILIMGNIIVGGLKNLYSQSLLNQMPVNEIKVENNVESYMSGNIFNLGNIKRKRKVSNINKDFIKLVENWEEVDKVIPITKAIFPISLYVISKLPIKKNQTVLVAEPPVIGIPESIAQRYINKYSNPSQIEEYKKVFPDGFKKNNNTIPILIPRYIEEIGKNIMSTNALPDIELSSLQNFFELKLLVNKSSILKKRNTKTITLKGTIVGFVDINLTPGIAIPQREAERLKKIILPQNERKGYETLIIRLKKDTNIENFLENLETQTNKQNIKIKKSSFMMKIAKYIKNFIASFETAIYLIGGAVLFVTGITIFYGFSFLFVQREKETKLYRFFGASKIEVITLLVVEAFIIGLLYSLAGYIISYVITSYYINIDNIMFIFPETIKSYLFKEELKNIFVFIHPKNIQFVIISVVFCIITSVIAASTRMLLGNSLRKQ